MQTETREQPYLTITVEAVVDDVKYGRRIDVTPEALRRVDPAELAYYAGKAIRDVANDAGLTWNEEEETDGN